MPFSKTVSRLLSLILGLLMAVPVYGLSGSLVLAVSSAVTTYLILEIVLVQPFSPKAKLGFLAVYCLSMATVIAMIFAMR
jgi:hypothetical protein